MHQIGNYNENVKKRKSKLAGDPSKTYAEHQRRKKVLFEKGESLKFSSRMKE